jgi:DnaJ-class molecular chaperone
VCDEETRRDCDCDSINKLKPSPKQVLSDEEKRRTYDNSGSKDGGPGEESRGSATSSEPVDIHLKYSGGDFTFTFVPPATEKPTKAPDMSVTLDVDLLDLYTGAEFNVTYTRQEVGLNLLVLCSISLDNASKR